MKDHAKRILRARERATQANVKARAAQDAYREAIEAARADGLTLQEVADVLGVSRQRVLQLLRR